MHLPCGAHLFAVAQATQARLSLIAAAAGVVQHSVGIDRGVIFEEALVCVLGLDETTADQAQ
ncbi:hypothetical protein D3C76_1716130 [compost metagenome]